MPGYAKDTLRMTGIALALLVLFGAIGIGIERTNRAQAIAPISPSPVDTSDQDLLVDAAWLAAQLDGETPPVVIDASDARQYALEHVPGAIHLWWQDTMYLNSPVYGAAFNLSARSASRPDIGATQEQTIVVYDNMTSTYASRIVWQLRTSGYSNAKVMDGGLAAWKGAGFPVTADTHAPQQVPAPTKAWIASNEITTDELVDLLDSPGMVILDTRNANQRQDTVNDTIRSGQIPGSRQLSADSVMRADGTFRDPDDLAAIFANAGLSQTDTIVVYGRFGVETGQVWLALRLAGYDNVRIYDAGWITWGGDPSLPIEPLGG
ncbi:MAG TPA: rhodanese-like domain-containing protein [Thermomicrobiales bacterium]|nr:rhodanese-like domain-containing protein [Thermomicrobiales bacterium]